MLREDYQLQHRRQTLYWWYARWGLGLEALIHTMFLGLSLAHGVMWMAVAQLAYLLATAIALYCSYRRQVAWSLIIVSCVIVVQEPVSTAFFGWQTGFWLYFMALPQIMFLLREIRFSLKLVALVGLALLFIVRSLVAPGETPVIDISDSLQNWLLRLNVVTTLLTLAVLAYLQAQTSAGLEEELSRIALTDPLTGLYNRRALVLMSDERMRTAQRQRQALCLAVLDIDHFKKINDRYGHETGDHILVKVAHILKTRLKAGDIAFRWGGEEFVILFGSGALSAAAVAAERLRLEMADNNRDGLPLFTITIGVAEWQDNESSAALFERADAALYAGKEGGRNRVVTAPPTAIYKTPRANVASSR